MRQKRAKAYKRVMALYTQTFGFRNPFQVLVSNDLILKSPPDISLPNLLRSCVQAECKLILKEVITQCCIEALYALGKEQQRLIDLAKRFERRKCNHREAIDPKECLRDVIGATNKHNYVLAAQSLSLRQSLEKVAGLPIIHFNQRHVLVLSPPSTATIRHKNELEDSRRTAQVAEMDGVVDGANVVGVSTTGPSVKIETRARKKVKGPNPLSVKKKKLSKAVPEVKKKVDTHEMELEDEDAQDEGGEDIGVGIESAEGDNAGRRRKKRKRGRGKGVVAEARAELQQAHEVSSGDESE